MFAGHDGADSGLAFRHGGKRDARRHHAFVEERAAEVHGGAAVTHNNRRDGRLRSWCRHAADVEASALELALEVARVDPQALDALGLSLQKIERFNTSGRDRRWM